MEVAIKVADRYTRRHAEAAYRGFRDALGKREATGYGDVGGWTLDHNSAYGGFVILEVVNAQGAVTAPMGLTRRNARDFYQVCWFAVHAMDLRVVPVAPTDDIFERNLAQTRRARASGRIPKGRAGQSLLPR